MHLLSPGVVDGRQDLGFTLVFVEGWSMITRLIGNWHIFMIELTQGSLNLTSIRHRTRSARLMVVEQLQTVPTGCPGELERLAHSIIPPLADAESPRHSEALVPSGGIPTEASG